MVSKIQPVYLWRKGNPTAWAEKFFESWLAHEPDENVELTVLLKGFEGQSPDWPLKIQHHIELAEVSNHGFDLTAYHDFASRQPQKTYLFFNSHTRIEAASWFDHLQTAWDAIGQVGLLGATGSWETTKHGSTFPNVHLRTTGFVVRGKDYLQAAGPLDTRTDCLMFEAGQTSLTKHFLSRGLPVKIVDAYGQTYDWRDWPTSGTFRSGDQERLMFSDNRTRHFHFGSNVKRKRLSEECWGPSAQVKTLPIFERLLRLMVLGLSFLETKRQNLVNSLAYFS